MRAAFLIFTLCFTLNASVKLFADSKPLRKVPLTTYLSNEMTILNGYYTIEYDESKASRPFPLDQAEIKPKSCSSILQLVSYLQEQLPEAKISIDQTHSNVVNIIDKSLNQANYSLNKTIDMSYNGNLSHLPKAVANAAKNNIVYVNTTNPAIINTFAGNIQVDINIRGKSAREVLTDGVYPSRQSRQLWQAFTSFNLSADSTGIYFPPPVR